MTDIEPVVAGITRFVDERLPRLDAGGVVVALTDRERLLGIVARGFAAAAAQRPLLPDARFQIGSISKSFAALIALQEREAGHLDFDAPVTDYVPWFAVRSRFAPITMHHLLTHTSGLWEGAEASPDLRHALWLLRECECRSAPGERFLYSNDGYKLVGVVLEHVTGKPFPVLLLERLLGPLGMEHSDPQITMATRATVASPHQRLFDDRPPYAAQPLVESPWYETASADGSIVSTAEDMCAYARLLLGRGVAPAGRIVSEESFAAFTQRAVEDPGEPGGWYGYGMATRTLDGRTLVGHSGGMVGYSSYLMTDPEAGLGVVVLMNGNDERLELVRYALAAARAAGAGARVPPPPPPADPALLGDEAAQYTGTYRALDGGGGELTLAAAAGCLLWLYDGDEVVLERVDPDVFVVPHPDLDRFVMRFWRDAAGRIVYATHGGDWFAGAAYDGPSEFAPVPDADTHCGHYRSWSPWSPSVRVFERRGALWLCAPWIEAPAGELELVLLPDGGYRVGADELSPDRLTIDTVIDGRATRAVYDCMAFYRASTP